VKDGDIISIDIPGLKLEVNLTDEGLVTRLKQLVDFNHKVKTGYLRYYAEKVRSASTGAVFG
jgi:dihydroxy-acid dehydratase